MFFFLSIKITAPFFFFFFFFFPPLYSKKICISIIFSKWNKVDIEIIYHFNISLFEPDVN